MGSSSGSVGPPQLASQPPWHTTKTLVASVTLRYHTALFNPETSILFQKRHPYTGNLNRETSGDSKNAFLHCGDVLATIVYEPIARNSHGVEHSCVKPWLLLVSEMTCATAAACMHACMHACGTITAANIVDSNDNWHSIMRHKVIGCKTCMVVTTVSATPLAT